MTLFNILMQTGEICCNCASAAVCYC